MEREALLTERLQLSRGRLAEIPEESMARERFDGFFGWEARALLAAASKAGQERAEALYLAKPGITAEETLLSVLSSVCSRAFSPQCSLETGIRCFELFLQCYALLAQGSALQEIQAAIYYDLFDYAEEDVRQYASAAQREPCSLTLQLPGELPWYAERCPVLAAAHTEDFSLFLDKALRDRLRPLVCMLFAPDFRAERRQALLASQQARESDSRFSRQQQKWLREIYAE